LVDVDVGWWGEPDLAVVVDADGPAVVVYPGVAGWAQQYPVGEVGWSGVAVPPVDVVGLRVGQVEAAAGAPAVAF
jgi:hypothetical protein